MPSESYSLLCWAQMGSTPLLSACLKGHASVVQALLVAGADVNTEARKVPLNRLCVWEGLRLPCVDGGGIVLGCCRNMP